jgi:predicted tellurium resistance membrane protein TerC
MDFSILFTSEGLIALATLSFLEIVLGIDNIIFISILTNRLPKEMRPKARAGGIGLALVARIVMLLGITWIIGFTEPLFEVIGHEVTGRDLILFFGGLFLLGKSTFEIHHKMEGDDTNNPEEKESGAEAVKKGFMGILVQIAVLDIVFSFDSILTAIGMTEHVSIMIVAVIISLIIMLIFSGAIAGFIEKHPTLQMLALSFLILIGFLLIADSFHYHVPKGYVYFAVFFSLSVELLNIRIRNRKSNKNKIHG